ncbi:flavin reductase family protein [Roseateles amylovorans]|uniref:Flavin reductase family protein n=1 Tax=Roseateles amylovorans TaxID=2978473 RepID=A0ABY6B2Q4_9BURK|nr:flavin reductase family protein [Roseateles amylovorans]UXH79465.1 flavin reductase family protein [Roseateles amylovorans]
MHTYDPSSPNLAHNPFNAIVGPRPIGWMSTKSKSGQVNLAPYSFFTALNYTPPIIGFSSIGRKDSLRNIEETGEFVWNLATRELAEAMNATCAAVPHGVNEFQLGHLTEVASVKVAPPRVGESPVAFECKVSQIIRLTSAENQPVDTWMIMGEVVLMHIAPHLLKNGVFDTAAAGLILRGGGPGDYFELGEKFVMKRPE